MLARDKVVKIFHPELARWQDFYQKLKESKLGIQSASKQAAAAITLSPADEKLMRYVRKRMQENEQLDRRISGTTATEQELTVEIRRTEQRLAKAAKIIPSDFVYGEQVARTSRILETKENQLHHVRTLQATLTGSNEQTRWQMQSLLEQRRLFDLHWKVCVKRLKHNTKYMQDMLERTSLAFNQGEELSRRIESHKVLAAREERAQIQEMVELDRQIEETERNLEFLRTKGYDRPFADLDPKIVRYIEECKRLCREKIQMLEEVIAKASELCCTEELDGAIESIEKQEEDYFACFQYLNEMNATLESAGIAVQRLRQEGGRLIGERRKLKEIETHELREHLERLETLRRESGELQQTLTVDQETMVAHLTEVAKFLKLLGCSNKTVQELLGTNLRNVTDDNLRKSLRLIEERVIAILEGIDRQAHIMEPIAQPFEDVIPIEWMVETQQCAECAEGQEVNQHDERIVLPNEVPLMVASAQKKLVAPEMLYRMHNLSKCKLPRSRKLVNKRYM